MFKKICALLMLSFLFPAISFALSERGNELDAPQNNSQTEVKSEEPDFSRVPFVIREELIENLEYFLAKYKDVEFENFIFIQAEELRADARHLVDDIETFLIENPNVERLGHPVPIFLIELRSHLVVMLNDLDEKTWKKMDI